MFGIGMPEMILILAVALIVIGPKKLPDLAKSLGRAFNEFKKATSEFKEAIELESEIKGVQNTFKDIHDPLKEAVEARGEQEISVPEDPSLPDVESSKKDLDTVPAKEALKDE